MNRITMLTYLNTSGMMQHNPYIIFNHYTRWVCIIVLDFCLSRPVDFTYDLYTESCSSEGNGLDLLPSALVPHNCMFLTLYRSKVSKKAQSIKKSIILLARQSLTQMQCLRCTTKCASYNTLFCSYPYLSENLILWIHMTVRPANCNVRFV